MIKKFMVLGLSAGILGILAYAGMSPPALASGAKPCARSAFQTKLVEKACADGGQEAAKKAMQKFVADVRKAKRDAGDAKYRLVCTQCHTAVKDDFPLTTEGLKLFNELEEFLNRGR